MYNSSKTIISNSFFKFIKNSDLSKFLAMKKYDLVENNSRNVTEQRILIIMPVVLNNTNIFVKL